MQAVGKLRDDESEAMCEEYQKQCEQKEIMFKEFYEKQRQEE